MMANIAAQAGTLANELLHLARAHRHVFVTPSSPLPLLSTPVQDLMRYQASLGEPAAHGSRTARLLMFIFRFRWRPAVDAPTAWLDILALFHHMCGDTRAFNETPSTDRSCGAS